MKIIIIIKQPLENLPPIINLMDILLSLNKDIVLICSKISNALKIKYSKNVDLYLIKQSKGGKIIKVINWLTFKFNASKVIENVMSLNIYNILWIGSADAAIAMGNAIFKFKYVFQCQELYDRYPFYQKRLKRIMQNSIINVVPNENRGAIFRLWYNLKEPPVILPNKPYYHPKQRNLIIEDKNIANIINNIKNKKLMIYQGVINEKERNLSLFAEAVESMNDDWIFVIMGRFAHKDGYINMLMRKYKNVVYLPPLPAPMHLQVTSWARIGIVSYTFKDLNHLFCAPNKTWEYTGFGIPMLTNDVPDLKSIISNYKSGECINIDNSKPDNIIDLINKIDNNYEEYSIGAKNYYNSINTLEIVKKIINQIKTKKNITNKDSL